MGTHGKPTPDPSQGKPPPGNSDGQVPPTPPPTGTPPEVAHVLEERRLGLLSAMTDGGLWPADSPWVRRAVESTPRTPPTPSGPGQVVSGTGR